VLNTYYLLVMVPLMQRRVPMRSTPAWLARNVAPFLICALVLIGGSARIVGIATLARAIVAAAVGCVLYGLVAALFIDSSVRHHVRKWMGGDVQLREVPL
jgi:hypothetical protein